MLYVVRRYSVKESSNQTMPSPQRWVTAGRKNSRLTERTIQEKQGAAICDQPGERRIQRPDMYMLHFIKQIRPGVSGGGAVLIKVK